ncbi:MAG TPA: hypothetical protein VL402_02370 [Xanthobacteraceae bacterium]|jgi:hypothetical protein|nr:hypothetical protein [Xanthobacteraceae bacterium]
MKKLILATVAAVVMAGSFSVVSVQPAAAQGVYIGVGDRPHYRHHRYYRRHYVRPRVYGPRTYRQYRRAVACGPGFSIQDGVCKPYSGY